MKVEDVKNFRPYDLDVVTSTENYPEHFTMSPAGKLFKIFE